MVYAYVRVSTDKQTNENQRFEINNFAQKNDLVVSKFVEEVVSGTKKVGDRELGNLLKKMQKGDMIICSEISRLGRSMFMIMGVINECLKRGIEIWTIKDNLRLDEGIHTAVIVFAFSLSAQIERDLISRRTKEAMARKKAEGVVFGRKKGSTTRYSKLHGKDEQIINLIKLHCPMNEIAAFLDVHRNTLDTYLKKRNIIPRSYGYRPPKKEVLPKNISGKTRPARRVRGYQGTNKGFNTGTYNSS